MEPSASTTPSCLLGYLLFSTSNCLAIHSNLTNCCYRNPIVAQSVVGMRCVLPLVMLLWRLDRWQLIWYLSSKLNITMIIIGTHRLRTEAQSRQNNSQNTSLHVHLCFHRISSYGKWKTFMSWNITVGGLGFSWAGIRIFRDTDVVSSLSCTQKPNWIFRKKKPKQQAQRFNILNGYILSKYGTYPPVFRCAM